MAESLGYFSGIISNDILSKCSDITTVTVTHGTTSIDYAIRYFYISDLLVQFTDVSGCNFGTTNYFSADNNYNIPFAIPFGNTPYVCIPYTFSKNKGNSPTTIQGYTDSSVTISLSNNDNNIAFLAIGPR